jgi:tetratricopeptide (TPR) repeat protein
MVKEQVWTGEYEKDSKGNEIYVKGAFGGKERKKKYEERFVSKQVITRSATVTAGFRLIDAKTGEIRATRTASSDYSKDAEGGNVGSLRAKDKILTDLMDRTISSFIPMITPHYEKEQRKFVKNGDLVDQGIELARKNLWDKAQIKFEEAIRKESKNHAAHYDLGLAFEVEGKLEEAEKEYNIAVDLKGESIYMEALANIRKAKADQEKLKLQMEKKKSENSPTQD